MSKKSLTQSQILFLRRIGSNNFNIDAPACTINSVIALGLAYRMADYNKTLDKNYYQITEAGIKAVYDTRRLARDTFPV